MAVSIRQALADDNNLDIGLVLVADQAYTEERIQELSETLTDLSLSQCLLVSLSIFGIEVDDDDIYENLSGILEKVPFATKLEILFSNDANTKKSIRDLCAEIFESFDSKLVVNYFGKELQTLPLMKQDGKYLWQSSQPQVMTNPDIIQAYETLEDLPEVLGSLGQDFSDRGVEIPFEQINDAVENDYETEGQEDSKVEDMLSPQDTPKVTRDLQGDPNDQKVVKEMKGIKTKSYPSPKMSGTYFITDLSQEAAIAKIFFTTIKTNLSNKLFSHNQIKLGVSALKPELFVSLNLIVESIEN